MFLFLSDRALPIVFAIVFVACNIAVAEEHLISKSASKRLPEVVSFNAHIRPLMSNTCFTCHGPDEEDNESGYRLDTFNAAISELPSRDGLVGIKPKDPDHSEVYLRIIGKSEGEQMPPNDFRHQLSDYDKALFKKWIEQGANYEQHWAYSPVARPQPPVSDKHASFINNPIDAFVVSRLEQDGLEPSRLADKATLLRRLSLDLIGLPPTPEELDRFLKDDSENAYELEVDRLISSKHFGERMASSWLDLVRFSDTVGFHGDQNQRIFPYRDYVIQSINSNKPFDQFTREQIAGDLLPNPTEEQIVATGFLRLNMMTREGGAQPKEYLAKYKADRVRTIGTAWLGSTLGCCECHNHKYDPFTAKDFYSLGAFFDDLRQWGVYSEYQYTPNPDLRAFSNDYPFPPEIRIQSPVLKTEMQLLAAERDRKVLEKIEPSIQDSTAFEAWLEQISRVAAKYPDGWIPAAIDSISTNGPSLLKRLDDNSVLVNGEAQKEEKITLVASTPEPMAVTSFRLEVLPDESNNQFVGRSKEGRFALAVNVFEEAVDNIPTTEKLPDANVQESATTKPDSRKGPKENDSKPSDGKPADSKPVDSKLTDSKPPARKQIAIAWIEADRQSPTKYDSGHEQLSIEQPWRSGPIKFQYPSDDTQKVHTAIFHFDRPTQLGPDRKIVFEINSGDVGRMRLAFTSIGNAVPGQSAIPDSLRSALQVADEFNEAAWSRETKATLASAWHRSTLPIADQDPVCRYYRDKLIRCRSGNTMSLIAQSLPPEKIPVSRVLPRGNWQDESGELAPPGVPHFLPQPKRNSDAPMNRLDLANWLTSADNPLTPRHFVNRTWKHFFGTGLSSKLDDLGSQGEWPSHPYLLDWLASEFVSSGWDMQHMIKLMVNSRTYKQAAAVRSDLTDIDPYNRLLSQQSPRRLEAEAVRDNALAISGLLFKDYIGGPSVFPYQPENYYSNLQFPDRKYVADRDYRQYRRGVYMHWQRTFLHPMLVNFDAPARDECTADRPLSNSPQQALTLLNDPSFVEASVAMTNRLFSENANADFDERLSRAFLLALARVPTSSEKYGMANLFQTQQDYYDSHVDEAKKFLSIGNQSVKAEGDLAELAAWSQVCRVILNLHETITRY